MRTQENAHLEAIGEKHPEVHHMRERLAADNTWGSLSNTQIFVPHNTRGSPQESEFSLGAGNQLCTG